MNDALAEECACKSFLAARTVKTWDAAILQGAHASLARFAGHVRRTHPPWRAFSARTR